MKKVVFCSFALLFSLSLRAQLVDVPFEFRAAKINPGNGTATTSINIESIEIVPEVGVQPKNKVTFTFSYLENKLRAVTANCLTEDVKCWDPELSTTGYYVGEWCYSNSYNWIYGCSEPHYIYAKAPK